MKISQVSLALATLASVACPQCYDPFDSVLCVDGPWVLGQFSSTDGAVSAFWSDVGLDSVEIRPPANCYPGACNFRDSDDARMVVKAAADWEGLYLYVKIRDDIWVYWSGDYGYEDDAIVLFLDKLDANTIWACTDCLNGLYGSRLTYTSQEIRVIVGGTSPGDTLRLSYYDATDRVWATLFLTWQEAEVPVRYRGRGRERGHHAQGHGMVHPMANLRYHRLPHVFVHGWQTSGPCRRVRRQGWRQRLPGQAPVAQRQGPLARRPELLGQHASA